MLFAPVFFVSAAAVEDKGFGENFNTVADESEYKKIEDPQQEFSTYLGALIAFTGMLGIFILWQVIMASYEYMTARGDEEKVTNSRKRIKNVIVAAIILVSGYLIASIAVKWGMDFTGYGR